MEAITAKVSRQHCHGSGSTSTQHIEIAALRRAAERDAFVSTRTCQLV